MAIMVVQERMTSTVAKRSYKGLGGRSQFEVLIDGNGCSGLVQSVQVLRPKATVWLPSLLYWPSRDSFDTTGRIFYQARRPSNKVSRNCVHDGIHVVLVAVQSDCSVL